MGIIETLSWLVFATVISFVGNKFLVSWLSEVNLLDVPNSRSSHSTPTPIGGGIAVLLAFTVGSIPIMMRTAIPLNIFFLCSAITLVALVSLRDDIKHVPAGIRLAIHFAAAIIAAYAIGIHGKIFKGFIPKEIEFILIVLAIVGFMNIFNFMDGIDGMSGAQTLYLGLSLALIFYMAEVRTNYIYISVLLSCSILGFLFYNWHPARIFLGDVGSITIGYILAILLLILAAKGYLVQALILPMYYLADAGFILIKRCFKLEKIWQAHNQHFFQKAVRAGVSHSEVIVKIQIANLLLLLTAILSLNFHKEIAVSLAFLLLAVLINIGLIKLLPMKIAALDIRAKRK
jgi:UDP-N-acetylmuramyl pentapeptide phosphotransferase/UDP-N-acetylglucosamine-1-phosphate transferase